MNVRAVKYERGYLLLRTDDPDMDLLQKFKPGEYDLVRHQEKRSTKAAQYLGIPIDVLREVITYRKG